MTLRRQITLINVKRQSGSNSELLFDEIDGLASTRDSNGEPLFASGNARVVRFDADVSFAPVASAADVFTVNGNSLSTALRDAATAVAAGNGAGINASLTTLDTAIGHIADQNAALGLSADFSKFGMGTRGQRFSMVVNDGVVEQLNVEAPGEYRVSSAEHMLGQL